MPLGVEPPTWELWRVSECDEHGAFRLSGVGPGRVELLLLDAESAVVLARETVDISTVAVFEWDAVHAAGAGLDQAHGLRRFLAWRRDPAAPRAPKFAPQAGPGDR